MSYNYRSFFLGCRNFFPFSFYSKEAAALYFFPAGEEIKLSKSWANAANKNLAVKYGLDHHKDEKLQMEPVGPKKVGGRNGKKGKKMSLHFYLSLKRRSKTWNCCAGKGWFISKVRIHLQLFMS